MNLEKCLDLTFLLMPRRKLRVATLGVLTPELEALRNERAMAAQQEVPKPKRIRYKNVRVARMAGGVASGEDCFPHDPGDVSTGCVGVAAEICPSVECPFGLGGVDCSRSSFDERNDRESASQAISTMEDQAFLDLPPFGTLDYDDYFLEEMF